MSTTDPKYNQHCRLCIYKGAPCTRHEGNDPRRPTSTAVAPDWLREVAESGAFGQPVGFLAETEDDPETPGMTMVKYWILVTTDGLSYFNPEDHCCYRERALHNLARV